MLASPWIHHSDFYYQLLSKLSHRHDDQVGRVFLRQVISTMTSSDMVFKPEKSTLLKECQTNRAIPKVIWIKKNFFAMSADHASVGTAAINFPTFNRLYIWRRSYSCWISPELLTHFQHVRRPRAPYKGSLGNDVDFFHGHVLSWWLNGLLPFGLIH